MLSSFQRNVSQNGFEGRNEGIFYLMMHSTHFYLWLCHARHMVKNQIVREETRSCHIVHSFWLAASVLYMPQPTDRIAYTTAYVTPVVEHWMEQEITWFVPHEESIRQHIQSWAYALSTDGIGFVLDVFLVPLMLVITISVFV